MQTLIRLRNSADPDQTVANNADPDQTVRNSADPDQTVANSADPDQTDLGLHFLLRPIGLKTSENNKVSHIEFYNEVARMCKENLRAQS